MLNKSRIADVAVAVLAALVAVSLAACNGLSTTGPTPGVADDAASTVILSADLADVEVGGQRVIDFTVPRTGTLAVTLRWDDQNNTVSAVLTGAGCSKVSGYAPVCQVRRSVERERREGRVGEIDHPDARGAYQLLVTNEGPGVESIHVTADLTVPYAAPVVPAPYPTPYPTSHPPDPRR